MRARVLYRDGLVLVLDKPAGLPVHRGPSGEPHLELFLEALRFGLRHRPGLAHRLDRDTSGCLVLGRHSKALKKLGRLFSAGRVDKTYLALTDGVPEPPEGVIELSLKKISRPGHWRMVTAPDGQPALTRYRLRASAGGRALVELRPATGRTHQLRVHLAALGTPVAGDPVYGRGAEEPLQLHARKLVLPLTATRPPVEVEAPLPAHMQAELDRLGLEPGPDA